jgi:adenylate cyclase
MESKRSLWDRGLRPLGATIIAIAGLSAIFLSYIAREETQLLSGQSRGWIDRLLFVSSFPENWFFDLRTARLYSHSELSPNLVILELTDSSLASIGRWPWTRTKHAELLDRLGDYGVRVVMFDMLFPEPESMKADSAFVAAINRFTKEKKGAVILGYGITPHEEDAISPLPDALLFSAFPGRAGETPMLFSMAPDKANFAAPALQTSEARYGFISARPDLDGVFRHIQLANETEKVMLPSLGLAGYQAFFTKDENTKMQLEPATGSQDYVLSITSPNQETRTVRLNPKGEAKIRFHGGEQAFDRIQLHDVLLGPPGSKELRDRLSGKAVLIGSSAYGAHDFRHTPISPQTPGMYMHANLFHSLDKQFFYKDEDLSFFFSILLYIIGITGVILLARTHEPLWESLGALSLLGLAFSLDYFYFAPNGYFIRLFAVLNGIVILYSWFTLLNVFKEAKEKKRIRDTFTRYVAPEIVKEMLANPDKLKVGGEKKEITMLFSDVRDFTTLSERLSAQELAQLLNIYMGKMTDILFETGGTLDKYIGDALVGFWGAPLDLPDHAYRAVKGAQQMMEALPAINKEFERRQFPKINVGIGLNTGEVSVGNMGSDKIFQYTALGDAMNLASRLEGLTKQYGVNLMISEFTLAKLGDKAKEFPIRPLDLVQVKGKSKAVKVYEVLPSWNPLAKSSALLGRYTEAYENHYLSKQFSQARQIFGDLLNEVPDDMATQRLLKLTEEYLKSPPPASWDGVTIFTSK